MCSLIKHICLVTLIIRLTSLSVKRRDLQSYRSITNEKQNVFAISVTDSEKKLRKVEQKHLCTETCLFGIISIHRKRMRNYSLMVFNEDQTELYFYGESTTTVGRGRTYIKL